MTNAFLAALLKVAAEERLRAERLRNCKSVGVITPILRSMNDGLEKEAAEHDGRAEVYERFADRIIADIAGELLLAEFGEHLSGDAELLEVEPPPFKLEYTPRTWEMYSWYRVYQPPLDPPSFLITGI